MICTHIMNPGIGERLEKDTSCFESYGFTFHRDTITCSNNSNKNDDGSSSEQNNNNYHGIFHSIDDPIVPSASLYIQVSTVSLIASIGPYLRTLVRLCVHPINPRSLQAIVVIGDEDEKKKMTKKKKHNNNNNDDDASRSIAHAIHMLIRNSMGAALFLNLHVVLPTGTSREKVLEKMEQNDDGCYEYPSVTVHEHENKYEHEHEHEHDSNSSIIRSNGGDYNIMIRSKQPFIIDLGLVQESDGVPPSIDKPLSHDCLHRFDPMRHFLSLQVTTRMCTIRLTPLIYHLSQRLLLLVGKNYDETITAPPASSSSEEEEDRIPIIVSKSEQQPQKNHQHQHQPMILVCLEKISNLYRVLMLVRDYGGIGTIGRQLVVVCKLDSTVERFRLEAINFISKNFFKRKKKKSSSSHANKNEDEDESLLSSSLYFPRVVSIKEARELIVKDIINSSCPSLSSFPNVIGFDLHENAMTLSENNEDAKLILESAGAVILGYESDGIPQPINEIISQYVQIQSRTSVNVVAAFSIVLHAIMAQ
jgi:hypothetical protein